VQSRSRHKGFSRAWSSDVCSSDLSTTGDPLVLPRNLFNPDDKWGFGAVGSLGQHTLAAGLVNTDENLTLLQFDLFGWPPLAALEIGRASCRDTRCIERAAGSPSRR